MAQLPPSLHRPRTCVALERVAVLHHLVVVVALGIGVLALQLAHLQEHQGERWQGWLEQLCSTQGMQWKSTAAIEQREST